MLGGPAPKYEVGPQPQKQHRNTNKFPFVQSQPEHTLCGSMSFSQGTANTLVLTSSFLTAEPQPQATENFIYRPFSQHTLLTEPSPRSFWSLPSYHVRDISQHHLPLPSSSAYILLSTWGPRNKSQPLSSKGEARLLIILRQVMGFPTCP